MAAGATYEPIETKTLGTATTTVTFSTISGSYTDLIVIVSAICASGNAEVTLLQYNGDTSSGLYSSTRVVGSGSTDSNSQSNTNHIFSGLVNPTVRGADIYHIQNYSNTTTFKTCLVRAGLGDNQTRVTVGLWRNTNAITSLTISQGGSINFSTGSTFTLYGIKAA